MTTPRLILLAMLLGAPAVLAQDARTTMAATSVASDTRVQPTLADLLWVARPLVIFADTPDDPRFQQQMSMLDARMDELIERDVVILTDTDPAAVGPLRKQLRPRDFGLVLIDLDGSVAQRRPDPTTARELINLIDRMPSRREEIGSRRP